MGEKDENICEGEKKSKGTKKTAEAAEDGGAGGGGGDGGKKEEEGGINTIVLKLDLHCDGCAKKVKRSIKNYDGVEEVKVDPAGGKLTVKGNVDANWLRDKVELKTKKKVELIVASQSQPKKYAGGGGGGDKKPGDKVKEKKPEDKVKDNKSEEKVKEKKPDELKKDDDNKPPKQSQGSTVILKIPLHCDGCAQKIRRIIKKIDGVENVSIDNDKDLVTTEGTMDVKELLPYLKQKLKRSVDIVSPKKDEGGGGGKKGKEAGGGGGDKKEKAAGGDKVKKEKAISGDDEQKKEKPAGGGGEEKKKQKVAGEGVDEKEKAAGGGDKKEKEGDGGSKNKKEKEINTNGGGGGGKKEKAGSDGDGGGKKEKASGGGGEKKEKTGGGGDKLVHESKGVINDGGDNKFKDKIDESKVEVNKMEYQGYGAPYTHYGVPMYNQSYANQDYGLMHTMYNNPYHASTSYVTEYNHHPEYIHQPYHHFHHVQQPQVPPPPPPIYLPPSQDHMFSDENPNACSTM